MDPCSFYWLIIQIFVGFLFLPLAVILLLWRQLYMSQKWFAGYLLILIFINFYAFACTYRGITNYFVENFLIIFEIIFGTWWFGYLFSLKRSVLFWSLTLSAILIWIFEMNKANGFYYLADFSAAAKSVLLTTLAFGGLTDTSAEKSGSRVYLRPLLWGMLTYHGIVAIYFPFRNNTIQNFPELACHLESIILLVQSLAFCVYIFSFYKKNKIKND